MTAIYDILGLVGMGAICYGAFLASNVLGWIILGVCLLSVAIVGTITHGLMRDKGDDS